MKYILPVIRLGSLQSSLARGCSHKSDGGAPTDASNQGAISDNFFCEKGGYWVTDLKQIDVWLTLADICMTFYPSNALCSGQGFFLPNLIAIGHF